MSDAAPRGPHGRTLSILHVDMDAFFAAVEQRDNPRLQGKPVVVGGSPFSRGVVATASYEARRFGIHSAMTAREAHRRCPQAVFVRPDHAKYARVSAQIRAIFRRYTDLVEPLSLDEAFLDVAGRDAAATGRAIKAAIGAELSLTASVGVSYCKFLAKLASDMDKPDGFTVISAGAVADLLAGLPVRRLWGVGPRSEEALAALGVRRIGELLQTDAGLLRRALGRRADELLLLARGIDPRPVIAEHATKSIGEETTFARDRDPGLPAERAELLAVLDGFAADVAARLERQRLQARTVTVKVRFADFRTITRAQTRADPTAAAAELAATGREIFARIDFAGQQVRLLGLTASNLVPPGHPIQLRLPL